MPAAVYEYKIRLSWGWETYFFWIIYQLLHISRKYVWNWNRKVNSLKLINKQKQNLVWKNVSFMDSLLNIRSLVWRKIDVRRKNIQQKKALHSAFYLLIYFVLLISFSLTHFLPLISFDTPLVFCFQGVSKEISGMKWFNNQSVSDGNQETKKQRK